MTSALLCHTQPWPDLLHPVTPSITLLLPLQGACGEEIDSGLEYYAEAEEDSQEGVTSACEDLCIECESNVDLNSAAPQQDGASDWQQAYDHTYGCLYYYCERTQVRHLR